MVFIIHKIQVILVSLWIMAGALQKEGSIFENGERYLIKNHAISKRDFDFDDFGRHRRLHRRIWQDKDCSMAESEEEVLRCFKFCQRCQGDICLRGIICVCGAGWTGTYCEKVCPFGTWGIDCLENCVCQNGAECDSRLGTCMCKDGWRGEKCSEKCSEGYFGYKCKQSCKCTNNATCHHITGGCNCTAGYQGSLCEEKCPVGRHGYQCTDRCKCQNDAICHHVDGSCECTVGWTGPVCAERCPEGRFGMNCAEECYCYNNASCNVITGECICAEGYYGDNCKIRCLSKDWGIDHSQECSCEDAECTSFTGNCSCLPGFFGSICQKRGCPADRWGYKCRNKCNCPNGDSCHPETGACCCQLSPTGNCSTDLKGIKLVDFLKQSLAKSCPGLIVSTTLCVLLVILLLMGAVAFFSYARRRRGVGESYKGNNIFRGHTEMLIERTSGECDL